MSRSERDAIRIVRLWLEEGVTAIPDHVLDAVLDQLPVTPQRRPSWPAWRTPTVNRIVGFGLAAAAVLVALVIGAQLVGSPNVIGPPAETVSPSAAATPAAGDDLPAAGPLEPGTRYRLAVDDDALTLTLAVPATGWTTDGDFPITGHAGSREETGVWFYTSASGPAHTTPAVFADPCTHEGAIEFEDSLAGEAEAWASVPGTEAVGGPTDVIVDGRVAKSVVVVVPEDVGCTNSDFWLLYDPACGAILNCTTYASWLGETLRIWIVDLGDGKRLTLRFEVRYPDASPDIEGEIQQIVDSIQFE